MNENMNRAGAHLLQTRRNHRRWTTLVLLLAILVSTGTFFVLRHSAIAATYKKRVLDCQQISGTVAHIHNDDCYDNKGQLVCTLEEIQPHLHSSECYEQKLVCGLEESAGHVHTEECWAEETELVCGLEEHVHGPECYELALICGEEEALPEYDEAGELIDPGHVHTEACYGNELICEEEEHVHSETCWETSRHTVCGMEEGEGAHQHDESCYVRNLICGQEELPVHFHDANCFVTVDLTPEEVAALHTAEEAAAAESQEPTEETAEGETAEGEASDATAAPIEAEAAEGEAAAAEATPVDAENYPAQNFEGEAAGLRVTVTAPAGAFPKDTRMVVSPIEDQNVLNAATAEVQGEVVLVQGVDISFYDVDGSEIEPMLPIHVEMVPVENTEIIPDVTEINNEQTVVHVDNELTATVVEQEDNLTPEVRFEADSFSAYIVVYTRIEKTVLASDGNNYRITLIGNPEAGIPEGAVLSVQEILEENEGYGDYLNRAKETLAEDQEVTFARFFDISILTDTGEIFEPLAPVQVTIELADAADENTEAITAVHFQAESGIETIETERTTEAVSFTADSFSVYGVVGSSTITVKYLTANGETYNITLVYGPDAGIPENAELVVWEIIPEETEDPEIRSAYDEYISRTESQLAENQKVTFARFFDITIVADGEEVQPSAPVEVKIEKIEELQTEGTEEIKAFHFTEAGEVQTIDTSVAEESVSFSADGFSVYGIVGTGTITTKYVTAEGETYTITVTYGPEAEIPEGSELVVREILRGTEEYNNYRAQTQEALGTSDFAVTDIASGENAIAEDIEDVIPDESADPADSVTYLITGNAQSQLTFIRLFDISIMNGEEVIEPKAPVEVVITYVEPINTDDGSILDVVHFTDVGVEVLENVTISEDGTEIKYQAESFSVYGTARSSVGEGNYIIYRDGNHDYALNYNNGNLGRQSVTVSNGQVTSTNDNVVWTFTSVTGGYRLSYQVGNTTYYLRNNNGTLVTTTNVTQASIWTYSSNRLSTGSGWDARYLQYANSTFSLSDRTNNATIYLAKIQKPATITIHYVNEAGEEILASHVLEDSTSSGVTAIEDIVQNVAGYTYHNTYIDSTSGTHIVPELRGAGGGTWEYQVYGQETYTQFSGDTDIYVVYGSAYGTGGGSGSGSGGGDDLNIDTPTAGKRVTPNNDGTFTLSLSITGEKDTGSETHGANVVLILDTSNSMNNGVTGGGTRFSNAVTAAQNVATNLMGLNTEDNPKLVEMCLVEFNKDLDTSGWYTEAGTANGQGTYPTGTFNRLIADASRNSGTNWEGALQTAIAAANGHQDGDATYIIFLTDGNPSTNATKTSRYDDEANATTTSSHYYRISDNYMCATDEARQIVQNGWTFYSIGMYGNVDVLKYLTNFAYTGRSDGNQTDSGHYYPAAQTDALIEALGDIADAIKNSLAVAGVDIKDGIATDVTHTALTTNVGSGTLGGVTYRKNGGSTASYTVTTDASGNATFNFSGTTVPGSVTEISYKKIVDVEGGDPVEQDATAQVYAATYNGTTYYMPIATVSDAGDFEWDISPLGTLEDNATYTVSFVVWPDQDAYDYVTNLNNGIEGYTWDYNSEVEVLTPSGSVAYYSDGVSQYPNIVRYPNGTFAAMSNTYQTVDYYVAKTEEVDGVTTTTYEKGDPIALDIPDPMVLTGSNFTVTKSWDDSLDQSQLAKLIADAVAQENTYSVTLNLSEDGEFYKSYTFEPVWNANTEKYEWPPQTINIAPALLTSTNPGGTYKTVTIDGTTYYVLNEGHQYVLEETNLDSHFEFVTETYHPALVNGVLMNVAFELNDSDEIVDGTTAEIVGTVPLTTFAGINTLKGGINIYKRVIDENENLVDDDSTFKVQVALDHINQEGTQIWFDTYEVDSTGAIVTPTADELNYWLDTSTGGHGATPAEAGPGPYYEQVKIIDAEKGIYKNASGVLYGVNGKVIKYNDETNYIGSGGYGNVGGYTNVLDIQDNWMIRIVNVLAGTTYVVTETETNGMQPIYEHWHDNASSAEAIVIGNAASNIRVTNKIVNRKVIVYKTDTSETPVPLADAEFTINGETLTSGTNGYTDVIELPISEIAYDLTETDPPSGYNALTKPVKVTVSSSGVTYIQSDYNGGNPQTAEKDADGNYIIHVRDNPGVVLPQTGGEGTLLFSVVGTIFLLTATLGLMAKKRRETACSTAYNPRH